MRRVGAFIVVAGMLAGGNAVSADFGLYGTAGTIGVGGGVAMNLNPHVGARLGYTRFSYDVEDLEESDLTFDGTADLGGVQALLDVYPFGGAFRISAGVVESAYAKVRAVPVRDSFTFNGVTYSADDIGGARGTADFGSIAPYIGLGFGRVLSTDGHFSFTADIGVAFTGAPHIGLAVTCNVLDPAVCARLADNVAAERDELQEDADDYEYWPVMSVGLSYRF